MTRYNGSQRPPRPDPECARRRSQDRASGSSAEVRELARLLREHLPAHALRGSNPAVWSDRIDDPQNGSTLGSGPSRRATRARPSARPPPQLPPGGLPSLRRAARQQIRAVGDRSQRRAEERRARRRRGRSTTGRPGRSSAAGVRLVAPEATGYEQLDLAGTERHPALGNSSFGVRSLRDRPHGSRPTARARSTRLPVCSTAPCTWPRAATTAERSKYRYRPAQARACRAGWLSPRSGRDLLLRRTTALVALCDDAGNPVRAEALPLIQAQLRAAGVEVVPVFAPGQAFFTQIVTHGLFDVALFSWSGSPGV